MLLDVGGDFRSYCIAEGVRLHLRSTQIFKTVRVDLFVHSLLQPLNNTRFALIARLLECGTQRLPDLRRLNQFVDDLYGALFANLVCLPIAEKLEHRNAEEYGQKMMVVEGVLGLRKGENPHMLREALDSFVAPKDREDRGAEAA